MPIRKAASRTAGAARADPLSQVLDAIPAALYVTDAQGRLTYFNQAAVEFSGRVPQLGTDQWCVSWRLYDRDGKPLPHDQCPMAIALKEGRAIRGAEAIAERPDGTRVSFTPYPTPLRDADGKIVGGVNMLVELTDRHQMQQALLESEQRYSRLVNLMPVGVYTCEAPSGVITFYNEGAATLWGQRPRVGDTAQRFCGSWKLRRPDGTPLAHEDTPMALALREGRAFRNQEVLIERPDGSRVSVLVNIDPLRNDQGEVVAAVNVFQDVTALKNAELEAARRAQQLATFMETASVGLHRVGRDGIILWANEAELQMLGYAHDEYVGRHIAEFHADQKVIADLLDRLRRGEKLRDHEARLKCRDGSIRTVAIDSSAVGDEGRFVHTLCITRDITDRKRAEELHAGLAAIVDSSDDAIVGKTLDGIITSWNKGAARIFGYTADEAIGRHITLIIPPERHAEEDGVLDRIRRGEKVDHFETERRARDGRRIDISLTVSPIRDSRGRVIGASKIARDITERKRIEAALRESDQRKDEFLATLAHELRNPLAPLHNGVQLLRMRRDDAAIADQTLDIMERQLSQLVHLIDDLLDVSRVSTGKIELKRQEIVLRSVLDSAIEIVQPLARARQQEIAVTLPADRIILDADPVRLAQLFSNLLGNAVKYSAPGSPIRVSAARERSDVVVSIEDQGIGIPPEALSEIFEPFRQLNRSLESSNSGLGIGLTLVKRLAMLHGGSVEARSGGAGQGSQFVVRLPAMAGEPPSLAKSAAPSREAGAQRRILVVDDNRDAAEMLQQLLQILGNEVHLADDGVQALEAVERLRPEVVLLDIGLPVLNGYDVCREIKEKHADAAPLVIAVTGWGQENDRKHAFDVGFDGHLVKPLDLDALLHVLADGFARRDRATGTVGAPH
jgi:PAS domain S-box-containing protein